MATKSKSPLQVNGIYLGLKEVPMSVVGRLHEGVSKNQWPLKQWGSYCKTHKQDPEVIETAK